MDKSKNAVKEIETTPIFFPDLGIACEVDTKKLIEARKNDRRGYATFPGVDSEGNELAIPGIHGNAVQISILLNDNSVKSKGSKKTARKMLGS